MVFPGQGSQSVGMLDELGRTWPVVRDTFREASDALGADLWDLTQNGPAEQLNRTENTQPAMLAAGVAAWRVLTTEVPDMPALAAGHSLGEYSALVAADALDFPDAVRLVRERALAMQDAVVEGAGAMAAILGMDDDAVQALCDAQAGGEVLEPVNFNSPGQVVIAGTAAAVDRALAAASSTGARKAVRLPVSVPSHCALMRPAAERLRSALQSVDLRMPRIPVLHNVSAAPVDSVEALREILAEQLYRPVRWVETVQAMRARGVQTLVEAGPGRVLTGLAKRIDRDLALLEISNAESLAKSVAALQA
ncbi:Malonyl CoA-acyl carrier protein transacylase [Thioalkalivibrio nitratireducens DSM 14787]|uniref:Malonyl CoA-acyl carrier protein transacylase n=1 Tax=Thioalkalivibrio nitratireducens (strain DSM 14787 / UNIQEM 213 / ALEN2) TaxID=1255043 RepID=L0DXY4_THIND|nr:Malonyl CoA-acyl carrier protein transacylase [Thioalkalivibrio nitratireducens DSM 14787]